MCAARKHRYNTACNFQSRLAFKTAAVEDSENAIGAGFAANLEAGGALLFKAWKRPLTFAKGVSIPAAEIRRVVAKSHLVQAVARRR